jgi:signal transduction histidine kinase
VKDAEVERGFLLPQDEAGRISALRRYDIFDSPSEDKTFDRITRLAARLLNVPIAVISLVDSSRARFKSHFGLDVSHAALHPDLCSVEMLFSEPWVIPDASRDPRTFANPLVTGEFGLRFYAGVPLKTKDGFGLGSLYVIDKRPREVGDAEIAGLRDLAAIVMDEMDLRLASQNAVAKESALRRLAAPDAAAAPDRAPEPGPHSDPAARKDGAALKSPENPEITPCKASRATALPERRRYKRPATAAGSAKRARHLLHALQTLRETERQRIARELHDGLAQSLAALRMDLTLLRQEPGQPVSLYKRFSGFDGLLESTIVTLRRIATDLHPTILGEGGLYFALRSLLRNFSTESGISCELIAQEHELVLDETASTAAFRIVQEALVNVGRHANAGRVIVMLHRDGANLSLKIHDDGCGITDKDLRKENCFGLIDMRERVRHLKGTMDVLGWPGGGSVIAISIPVIRKKIARRAVPELHPA